MLFLFPVFVYSAYFITLINLLIHVLLRGLWIGAIGLRSVSGEIDYQKLRLQPRFGHFLRKRTPSFDNYIYALEEAASLMFAFTFLLIMMLGSAFLFLGFVALALGLVSNFVTITVVKQVLLVAVLVPSILFGFLYFLDFILLGRIKRSRFFGRWYYPVYRVLGILTLAFTYRPIYYNFIDNTTGRRALRLALPYLLLLFFAMSISYDGYGFWVGDYDRTAERSDLYERYLYSDYYDDIRDKAQEFDVISIPAQRIAGSVLPVFLEYLPDYDAVIRMKCPDLPESELFVIQSDLYSDKPAPEDWGSIQERITCLQSPFELLLNGKSVDLSQGLLTQKADSRARGIQHFLPIDSLPPGLHTLELRIYERARRGKAADTIRLNERIFVPFYRE
jgi:hypothetical protein